MRWPGDIEAEIVPAPAPVDIAAVERAAYEVGFAQGHFQGRQFMLNELDRIVAERHQLFPEVLAEDVQRLKRMIH